MPTTLHVSVAQDRHDPDRGLTPMDCFSARPYLEHLGKELRIARKSVGLNCKELAEAVGLSEPHISHIEIGTAVPRLVKLLHLMHELGMPLPYPFVPRTPPHLASTMELLAQSNARTQAVIHTLLVLLVERNQDVNLAETLRTLQDEQCA